MQELSLILINKKTKIMNTDFKIKLLTEMTLIRTVEELISKDFLENKIFSFLHLSIGQEASAVGVCSALTNQDLVFGNHRSHHHYLAKGGNLEKMLYEIYGDERGCCKGYGGSMHMLDREVGFVGSTPILGSVAPLGTGIAFTLKEAKKNNIAVIFIGDGAAEEGAFYESINLASLLKLPILFIIEDNKYSVNSSANERKASNYSHEKIITGLGAKYLKISGKDAIKVFESTKKIKSDILNDFVPFVLHIEVTRGVYGHSGPLKENNPYYRPDGSIDEIQSNDCIKYISNQLETDGVNLNKIMSEIDVKIKNTENIFQNIRKQIKIR